jgi:hypothetical protein
VNIAAAVVGSAAAAQVIGPERHPDGEKREPYTADNLRAQADEKPAPAELDVHAALNTYETPDRDPGVYGDAGPLAMHGPFGTETSVVGANGRRLIVREVAGNTWIGGCEIADPRDLRILIARLLADAYRMEADCRDAAEES